MLDHEIYCAERISAPLTQQHQVPEEKSTNLDKPRILIIEDEFLVAWHLQAILHDMHFLSCDIANDSQAAIDLAINGKAELILADINLGDGSDGIETVRRIFEYMSPLVIIITAYSDEANLSRIRALAPTAPILSKPVSPKILRATILKLFPAG